MLPIKKHPELCIPRMPIHISRETIFNTFCKLNIGFIERISEIPLKSNAQQYKRVIIRLKWNPSTEQSAFIYQRILKKEPVFIVYDMPWYWKVVPNQMPTEIVPPPPYVSTGVITSS